MTDNGTQILLNYQEVGWKNELGSAANAYSTIILSPSFVGAPRTFRAYFYNFKIGVHRLITILKTTNKYMKITILDQYKSFFP